MDELLEIDDLNVTFLTEDGDVHAVDGVSFRIDPGESVAVVGESGSGKSATAMTIVGLTRSKSVRIEGSVRFRGTELLDASETALRRVRGAEIAVIFQDPLSALNPVQRVGAQIVEQIQAHERVSRASASARATELLVRVGIPEARRRARSFPHEFSGGMRQRVMIAMALACAPSLLIADEPTTGLDVTVQMQILSEIDELRRETGLGVLLVTHDLGVVAEVADRVVVMYGGRVVETGDVETIFDDPLHPYTWGLLGSIPDLDRPRVRRLPTIPGQPPASLEVPAGCVFAPRCPHRFSRCDEAPPLRPVTHSPGHLERCWLSLEDKRSRRLVDGGIGLAGAGSVA
jgi:peptide/nickel transport system ATP-binding protein